MWPFNRRKHKERAMSEHDIDPAPQHPEPDPQPEAEAIPEPAGAPDAPAPNRAPDLDPPAEDTPDVLAEREVDNLIRHCQSLDAALATARANPGNPAALEACQRECDGFRQQLAATTGELERYRAACKRIANKARAAVRPN